MAEKVVEQAYLAKPPGECCITGNLHDGEPRGALETVEEIETYVVYPREGKSNGNIVLYFPDVWGLFKNGLLVMDGFANAGYLTIGLDYFSGDPVWKHRKDRHDTTTDPSFDYEAWKQKHQKFAAEAVPRWVDAVKAKYGTSGTRYACVGYCFGAPYVCDQLSDNGICIAGAFAHPAFLKEDHFRNLKAVDILIEDKRQYHVQLFSGVEHGFALRGNQNDPYERWVKEQSLRGIVDWFDYWLALESFSKK
ncbi:hypothetical protein J7T55_009740 [Diaporthe amygdali]|uniref:uncharacterized protein n=1 Tax=Phomopsis amygdali TaxID=1214568 RepID=UPI0022FE6737|nr:uncharacterized protein J7T55_009740 [Diaporthe amygdali]KAJ0116590.1 hypothetical protein J7T55_009740 [Diaporthe amygdali]